MENKPMYVVGNNPVADKLRDETLRPAYDNWVAPTPDEINLALSMANWSGEQLARRTGVQGSSIRAFLRGEKKMPYAIWALLCEEAGLGKIW